MSGPPKRVGVLYLIQESNTFSPLLTTLDDFGLLTGPSLLERWRGTRTEIGGFLDAIHPPDAEPVPLLAGWAITKGRIRRQEFARLGQIVDAALRGASPLDGLLLALHGAMCAESVDDAQGALLARARAILGPAVPIVVTLDLHANLTQRVCRAADAVIGYRTYPHIDMYQTGAAASELLLGILAGAPRPRTVMRKIPMIVPAENMQTTSGPMAEVWRAGAALKTPDIVSFSVFGVQPWLDIAEMGCSIAAVTTGEESRARRFSDAVARRFWHLRREFDVSLLSPAQAIREALANPAQPVVLSESSDSPTAGSPGDSADMLRALLKYAPDAPAVLWLCDEAAVDRAVKAGVGARVKLALGGSADRQNRRPVEVDAVVRSLSDGHFVNRGMQNTGMAQSMGRAAVLQVGAVSVLVSALPAGNIDPELFRSQGLEPRDYKIVIVKSATGFRAEYGPFAARMLVVDTPGVSSANLRSLPYRHVPRPIDPLDEMEVPF